MDGVFVLIAVLFFISCGLQMDRKTGHARRKQTVTKYCARKDNVVPFRKAG